MFTDLKIVLTLFLWNEYQKSPQWIVMVMRKHKFKCSKFKFKVQKSNISWTNINMIYSSKQKNWFSFNKICIKCTCVSYSSVLISISILENSCINLFFNSIFLELKIMWLICRYTKIDILFFYCIIMEKTHLWATVSCYIMFHSF